MSKIVGITLTLLFSMLSVITSNLLWQHFGNMVFIQSILILIIATTGEHFISGKGYYHYTEVNGLFFGRVPTWIPLMWIVAIQGSFVSLLMIGFQSVEAIAFSGIICSLIDFYVIEPLLSRKMGVWRWHSVEDGFFRFIPPRINRFTAPFGNYVTWMVFPLILNAFLHYSSIVLMIL